MVNKSLFKFLQSLIKYVVGSGILIMTIHVGLLILGINEPISEWLVGFSVGGFTMLLISSYVLRLCLEFRICLYYEFIVGQLIKLQRSLEIFETETTLYQARWVTFVVGTILTLTIVYHEFIEQKTCWKSFN